SITDRKDGPRLLPPDVLENRLDELLAPRQPVVDRVELVHRHEGVVGEVVSRVGEAAAGDRTARPPGEHDGAIAELARDPLVAVHDLLAALELVGIDAHNGLVAARWWTPGDTPRGGVTLPGPHGRCQDRIDSPPGAVRARAVRIRCRWGGVTSL